MNRLPAIVNSRKLRASGLTILIGLGATLLVLLLSATSRLDWLELKTLDLRFQYANSIPSRDDIVIIAVDDRSLERVGRWPWPRYQQAAILSVLAQAGARAVLVDLSWLEPDFLTAVAPRFADQEVNPLETRLEDFELRFGDFDLRNAVQEGGNAYLAFHYRPRDLPHAPFFVNHLVEIADGDSGPRGDQLAAEIRRRGVTPVTARNLARLALALESNAEQTPGQLARDLNLDPHTVDDLFESARAIALRRLLNPILSDPAISARPVFETVHDLFARISTRLFDAADTPLKEQFQTELRYMLNERALLRSRYHVADPSGPLATAAISVDALEPPYHMHADGARRCGFVVTQPDPDGVVRRTPLLIQHGTSGPMFGQLGFALAVDALAGTERLAPAGAERVIDETASLRATLARFQFASDRSVLIPWLPSRAGEELFSPVSAGVLVQIIERRRQIEHNLRARRLERREFLQKPAIHRDPEYAQFVARFDSAAAAVQLSEYFETDEERRPRFAELNAAEWSLDAWENLALARIACDADWRQVMRRAGIGALPGLHADDPWYSALAAALLLRSEELLAANPPLAAANASDLTVLSGRLAGRFCLVGYTASALADMTPTPTHPRLPGVYAHACLLNGILANRTVGFCTPPFAASLTLLLGIMMTLISVRLSPRVGLLVLLLATFVVLAVAAGLFYFLTFWLVVVAPIGAMLFSYVAIAVYRYVFLERERRQLTNALRQYTSPALARLMSEDAELCRRAETREVSAMFTDLKGFTTLSEQLGAEKTQRVLNVTLGGLSEVLLRHEAMINKFLGDGIFAFWNPVIYAQPDHARRACEAAIELQIALAQLVESQSRTGESMFEGLSLRVGVATGNAVVGPCGSEQKFDYTCIGDTVNLASRLESANKAFGTRTLVNSATRDAAGSGFEYRALGGVIVKGKQQAVPVFELLGHTGQVNDPLRAHADCFSEALEAFQARRFTTARELFTRCQPLRPDDLAAATYVAECERLALSPPADDWLGAIELSEK